MSAIYNDYSDPTEITDNLGNVLCDNGHTLVKYSGTADVYKVPSSVTRIMDGAFKDSRIRTFVLDRDMTWDIKKMDGMTFMFQNTGLSEITIKEGVTAIPDYLFARTGITSLELPSSIRTVGVKAFYDCNELTSVAFRDNSCLSALDDYSFAYDERISTISFGSSRPGYMCEIGLGAFLFCNDLSTVTLDDDFILKTIGSCAFAKRFDNVNKTPSAISFNAVNGILIPKETGEVGAFAFSTCAYSDTLMAEINSEPWVGYVKDLTIRTTPKAGLVGTGWTIAVERDSQLSSIDVCAFAGYKDVKSVDLSNCSILKVLQRCAFAYCLNNGILQLPPNIEEIYSSFYFSTCSHDILIPKSVRIMDSAFDGSRVNIIAPEDSQLEYYSEMVYNTYKEDFRTCSNLTFVKAICDDVLIQPGIYEGEISGTITNGSKPVKSGHVLQITDETTYMSWEYPLSYPDISCSDNNPWFKNYNNAIYYEDGEQSRLVYVSDVEEFEIKEGSTVRHGILGPKITKLTINAGCHLETGSLSGCDCLMVVEINGQVDTESLSSALYDVQGHPSIYLKGDYSDADLVLLSVSGNVYLSFDVGSKELIVPALYKGKVIHYQKYNDNEKIKADVNIEEDAQVISSGLCAYADGYDIVLDSFAKSKGYIWLIPADYGSKIDVRVDYNGGIYEGATSSILNVAAGKSVSDYKLPVPVRDLSTFGGWSLEMNGAPVSDGYRLDSSCTLYAIWTERDPVVINNSTVATLYCDGSVLEEKQLSMHQSLRVLAEPKPGFELFKWVVNGVVTSYDACDPLVLDDVTSDISITFTSRYYSSSSGLIPIIDRDLPTLEESMNLTMVTELGGIIDTSRAIWEGHSFRAGNYLYMAESDTGYILKCVQSAEAKDYYHQLGYGDGVIIDYKTSKAYDLDLNYLYELEYPIIGAQFHDGKFYTSGYYLYSFTPGIDSSVQNGIKKMDYIAYIDNIYTTYGFTSSIFVDHYCYRIVVDGYERGIVAIDLDTGEISTRYLDSIRAMYLDDGWISYYDGCIYLPAYTRGLFGEVATDSDDVLAFIQVDGLQFGQEQCYVFKDNRGWPSQLIIYDDLAFIAVGGSLYAFELKDGVIDPSSEKKAVMNCGHGSIVMDVSHYNDDEPALYFYGIPYSTSEKGMYIVEYKSGKMTSLGVKRGLPVNYNSQAVRADIDGRVIWYNDSGHIFDYTTPEKNVFYFFIDDGESAQWYQAHGATAVDAIKSLGKNIVDINDHLSIVGVNGKHSDRMQIYVLKQEDQSDISSSLQSYSWVRLYDLYDRSYDSCHYYRISLTGELANEYTYLDDSGNIQHYQFKDNIGERSLIGTRMIPGDSVKTIKYYDGNDEILELRSIYAPELGASWELPTVIRDGVPVRWYNDGVFITSLEVVTQANDDIILYGIWELDYIDIQVSKGQSSLIITLPELDGAVYLKAVVKTADGFKEETCMIGADTNWRAEISSTEADVSILLYLVEDQDNSFEYSLSNKIVILEELS